jgi:hypothetical protein
MSDENRGTFDIPVLSKDPEKKDDEPKHDSEGDKAVNGDAKKTEGDNDMVRSLFDGW